MPWQQNGNGPERPGGQSPWSSQGGGGGAAPPSLDDLLAKAQNYLRTILPQGGGIGFSGGIIIFLVLLIIWLASGIFIVQPGQVGVVLRFGEYTRQALPGANYRFPSPIEVAEIVDIQRIRKTSVGYDDSDTRPGAGKFDIAAESLMLTGDENIVDIDFDVFWRISDAPNFIFKIEDPDRTVKAVAESSMREVVGKNKLQPILTERRGAIETEVRSLMQEALDFYPAGILITEVKMQKSDPPDAVIAAYRDVQAAKADKERLVNEATSYANRVVPEARGNAAKVYEGAEAYYQSVIAEAKGQADRFLSIYSAYRLAPELTRERIYLETLEKVFSKMNKVIIDQNSGSGVVPYLPLSELGRGKTDGEQQ